MYVPPLLHYGGGIISYMGELTVWIVFPKVAIRIPGSKV